MLIAIGTTFDSRDIRKGSGSYYNLWKELERMGHEIVHCGPVTFQYPLKSKLLRKMSMLMGYKYFSYIDPWVARASACQIGDKLSKANPDVLLTNDYGICAFAGSSTPKVLYTEAMITYDWREQHLPYARFGAIGSLNRLLFAWTIKHGLQAADRCIFPAEWSAIEAAKYLGQSHKIRVIPYGANIDDPGEVIATDKSVAGIGDVEILFVGKDWPLKGGDTAINVATELNRRGISCILHCVGSKPSLGVKSDFIRFHGLLDKSKPQERASLERLYKNTHFFLLPSSCEGYVISPLEAAAYGIPALGYDTIGVNGAIVDQKTGVLVGLETGSAGFADAIQHLLANPHLYRRLALGAREHFNSSANWTKTATRLLLEIDAVLGERKSVC